MTVTAYKIEFGCSLEEACRQVGVPRTTYTRWLNKLSENGSDLESGEIPDQSRRPKTFARETSESTKQRVIEEAANVSHKTASSITKQLQQEGISIGNAKVIEILKENGLYGEIEVQNAKGEWRRKSGLLRLCQKRPQQP